MKLRKVRLNVAGVKELADGELAKLLGVYRYNIVRVDRLDVVMTRINVMLKEKTPVDDTVFVVKGNTEKGKCYSDTYAYNWMKGALQSQSSKSPKVVTPAVRDIVERLEEFNNTRLVMVYYNDKISHKELTSSWRTQNAEFYK